MQAAVRKPKCTTKGAFKTCNPFRNYCYSQGRPIFTTSAWLSRFFEVRNRLLIVPGGLPGGLPVIVNFRIPNLMVLKIHFGLGVV